MSGSTKIGRIFTIANNVLIKIRASMIRLRRIRLAADLSFGMIFFENQRRVFGIFGRNTASSPIAGRNAQT